MRKYQVLFTYPYLNEEISGIIYVNLYFYLNDKCSNFLVVAMVTNLYFQPNAATSVWFRRYMWGLVFLRQVKFIDKFIQSPKESNLSPIGLLRSSKTIVPLRIKLVGINYKSKPKYLISIFSRNTAPPIWCETSIKLFEVQKM